MAKRTQGSGSTKPRPPQETKPVGLPERHSGEGSASVLETLQKMEKRRLPPPGDHPGTDDDPPG